MFDSSGSVPFDCVCGSPPIGVPTIPEPPGTVVGGAGSVAGVVGALPPSSDCETGLLTGSTAGAGSVDVGAGGAGSVVALSSGAAVSVVVGAAAVVVAVAEGSPMAAVVGVAPAAAVGAGIVAPDPMGIVGMAATVVADRAERWEPGATPAPAALSPGVDWATSAVASPPPPVVVERPIVVDGTGSATWLST